MSYCLSLLVLVLSSLLSLAQRGPNIIYIMADDLGYADLSCFGRKDYKTPHLDKLASEGMKFVNAYAGSTLCTPTRTAFMTGRYPARTAVGLWEPLTASRYDSIVGLTASTPSLPALLKKNGYGTFLVGKWHLGFQPDTSPNANGFDEFFGCHSGAIDYIAHTNPRHTADLFENEKPVVKDGYITDRFKEKAIDILGRDHTKPFFLCLMFTAPHWPWQAPGDSMSTLPGDQWRTGGSPATYAQMVLRMDDAIGAILEKLEELDLAKNTVVIFTSDNGGEQFSDMGGLNGKKGFLKEGGIKVPAFIRWPGKIPPDSYTEQAVITMDWTATILKLANARPDPAFPLDGIDLLPVCLGKQKNKERTFFWRMSQRVPQKAVRDGNFKYLQDPQGEYLFNVVADPGEKEDLKTKNKKLFERLKKKYNDWEKTVLKPVPLPI
jgi:arylsulfatase A-like enzyme